MFLCLYDMGDRQTIVECTQLLRLAEYPRYDLTFSFNTYRFMKFYKKTLFLRPRS